jgi:hypothetical protein
MAEDKKEILNRMPRAKRARIIQDITTQLRGTHLQDSFEHYGHTYTLSTLEPMEEGWAEEQVVGVNAFQFGKAVRAPRLAAALRAVDGTPVKDLFEMPTEMDPNIRGLITGSKEATEAWLRSEINLWIQEDWQPELITALYDNYLALGQRRAQSLEHLRPTPPTTPTGGSSATSSHEKESSSATQVSPG